MKKTPLSYDGKRVIVSGCYSGIGNATAQLLIELGAEVHGIDFRPVQLGLASFQAADLRQHDDIDRAVKNIGGPIDALFNCAGLGPSHPPLDVLKVNFLGTRHLTEQVAALMGNSGAIVSIGSIGGAAWRNHVPKLLEFIDIRSTAMAIDWFERHATLTANAYAFTKEAIAVWTRQESATLIKRGIRINATSPGSVQTPMLEEIERDIPTANVDSVTDPFGRRAAPREQAWPLAMLNSDEASYINGADLAVDGGAIAKRALAAATNPPS